MTLRSKVLAAILVLFLVFGLASCGNNSAGVTYSNYDSIRSDIADGKAPNKDAVVILLGGNYDKSAYDDATGNGTIVWSGDNNSTVTVVFSGEVATSVEATNLYQSTYTSPIGFRSGAWEWIIIQLGKFTFYASNLFGLLSMHYYWIGLLIMTLVIRTLGWPIYAKSNDMSLKMNMAQPEIQKIQEKYANRKDQASQQRMQMETMEIYRKYKINFFGCLMPLLQMPIFIAMYQVVRRFPIQGSLTAIAGSNFNPDNMSWAFLWLKTLDNSDYLTNLPLALLVGALMFISQKVLQKKTKQAQRNSYNASPKAQQSQKTMQYFMYFMVIMMVVIAIGNAGIALYWIIGTTYQILQSYLAHRNMDKRQEMLRRKI